MFYTADNPLGYELLCSSYEVPIFLAFSELDLSGSEADRQGLQGT